MIGKVGDPNHFAVGREGKYIVVQVITGETRIATGLLPDGALALATAILKEINLSPEQAAALAEAIKTRAGA